MRAPAVAVLLMVVPCTFVAGENIDPSGTDQQYAWGENIGWVNAEPTGDGGRGVEVGDFALTGWMWAENSGWISASCSNTVSCGTNPYGVLNDGQGNLSGFAWSENAGWVDFAPSVAGVTIDPVTGEFSGRAWGENVGWISFDWPGGSATQIRTSWNCSPAPPVPSTTPVLTVSLQGPGTMIAWSVSPGATAYDLVAGSLDNLRANGGDFALATQVCATAKTTATSLVFGGLGGPNEFYLVRVANCGGVGSYDSGGSSQVAARDAGIAISGNDCN